MGRRPECCWSVGRILSRDIPANATSRELRTKKLLARRSRKRTEDHGQHDPRRALSDPSWKDFNPCLGVSVSWRSTVIESSLYPPVSYTHTGPGEEYTRRIADRRAAIQRLDVLDDRFVTARALTVIGGVAIAVL